MQQIVQIVVCIFLFLCFSVECRISYPKKSLKIFKFQNNQISTLQLIQEPYINKQSLTLKQDRLQFDSDLLFEQEQIEDEILEFPKINSPKQNITNLTSVPNYSKRFKLVISQLSSDDFKFILTGFLIISVFSCVLWLLLKLKIQDKISKKSNYNEEEQKLIPNEEYSIMNSQTISSEHSIQRNQEQKYKLIEYPEQIKNPYDESFIKASLRGTTKGSSACDQSLLEIDELLSEMLGI